MLSTRAVVGDSGQRCWIERGDVVQERAPANMPGAIAGAVIGGILGHQIGNGSGRDLATVGGVVAGAAVGSQVGRTQQGPQVATQDVRRCADAPGPRPTDYWDVAYRFRGNDHRVQLRADTAGLLHLAGGLADRLDQVLHAVHLAGRIVLADHAAQGEAGERAGGACRLCR